jgi:hypothetical protein
MQQPRGDCACGGKLRRELLPSRCARGGLQRQSLRGLWFCTAQAIEWQGNLARLHSQVTIAKAATNQTAAAAAARAITKTFDISKGSRDTRETTRAS